jgi:hypothetical protein
VNTLDKWHKTRTGLFGFALVEFLLAYGVASWAIDSGNLLLYGLTVLLIFGAIQNLVKLIGSFFHGKRQTN